MQTTSRHVAAQPFGASPGEWDFLAHRCNLKQDLLPVVSNPNAIISPDSKMHDLGKTPSRYDKAGQVVGIAKWTQHIATESDIERWSKIPDYGICIQTRSVRAIDVDVSHDTLAATIYSEIAQAFASVVPVARRRPNSTKFLVPFRLPGDYAKRIIHTAHGNIEFLATGQQFIASGTHPSGVRYVWDAQPEFHDLTPDEFEALWSWLETMYGVKKATTVRRSDGPRVARDSEDADDPMVDWLFEHWEVRGEAQDGRIDIRCPFDEEHTTDSGPSSTSYYPAGVGGFQRGHFVCLHAHCAGREDEEFIERIGNPLVNEFPDFSELDRGAALIADLIGTAPASDVAAMPSADCAGGLAAPANRKTIPATIDRVFQCLANPQFTTWDFARDQFRDEMLYAKAHTLEWRPVNDDVLTMLRRLFEQRRFAPVSKEMMRDALSEVAARNQFDSAQIWLESLQPWDGELRAEFFLSRVFGCEDSPYARAVGRYVWTGLAGRIIQPGVKADMVPIIHGQQGLGKSTAVKLISPAEAFFREVDLTMRDDDLSRRLRGCLVAEIGELRGLHSRDLEGIKQFLSRTHENWIPKFKEHATVFPRRNMFFGTTNQREFLADETGNRRFLPVTAPGIPGLGPDGRAGCDLEWLRANRNQLWAEGAHEFRRAGVAFADAERLALGEHEAYRIVDAWEATIGAWIDAECLERFAADDESRPSSMTPRGRAFLRLDEVARGALNIAPRELDRAREIKIGKALHALGYVKARRRIAGRREHVYCSLPMADGDRGDQ